MGRNVLDESLLGTVIKDSLPQVTRLVEVLLSDLGQKGDCVSDKVVVHLVQSDRSGLELDGVDGAQVVGTRLGCRREEKPSQLSGEDDSNDSQGVVNSRLGCKRPCCHPAGSYRIAWGTLEPGHQGMEMSTLPEATENTRTRPTWGVDRQLLVVGTDSVTVGVGVREQSGLQDL